MMKFDRLLQKAWFRLRLRPGLRAFARRLCWRAQGAQIGSGTNLPPMTMTWPHQVSIGRDCVLEPEIFFKFDGVWCPGPSIVVGDKVFIGRGCEFNIRARIEIGRNCLIASGCKFIDHDHGIRRHQPMNSQEGPQAPIRLDEDVWLGVNAVVLKGVTIGRGAIVGAGAVVTKSVPPYEVWAGIPARKIGERPGDPATPPL